nr:nuclease SbcCD subunit C-like [Osmia lignaria]
MALINPVIKSTSSSHESKSVYILVLRAEAFSIIDNIIQSCFKMKTIGMIIIALAWASIAESKSQGKKEKRGVALLGPSGYDFFGVAPIFSTAPWTPTNFGSTSWSSSGAPDVPLTQVQVQATHDIAIQTLRDSSSGTPSIAYPPDVLKAIQQAKDANRNVNLAQQRVAEAKQAAVIQQKLALAKEASAREAAARSQEISSNAEAEARASAKQLVAAQQRLASLKDAVAAAQRVAAAREAAAAAAIQRNAAETAAQLQKQDVDKQISQSEQEAKEKDIIAAKENAVANAVQLSALQKPPHHPWNR